MSCHLYPACSCHGNPSTVFPSRLSTWRSSACDVACHSLEWLRTSLASPPSGRPRIRSRTWLLTSDIAWSLPFLAPQAIGDRGGALLKETCDPVALERLLHALTP